MTDTASNNGKYLYWETDPSSSLLLVSYWACFNVYLFIELPSS